MSSRDAPHSPHSPRSPTSRAGALLGVVLRRVLRRVLPNARDRRYPRPAWYALLRALLGLWWLLGVGYLAFVLTRLLVLALHMGVTALGNPAHLAAAALLDRVVPVVQQRPWLLAPALGALATLLLVGRWAHADHARESRVLALRVLRAPTPARLARVVRSVALRWLWHRGLLLGLVVASLLAGAALALLSLPTLPHR
jgi:hypothetical protein